MATKTAVLGTGDREGARSQLSDTWRLPVFAGSGYLEGKELQNLIHELQQARKKAGLVGSRCRGGKGPLVLKYRRSSVFIRSQQDQVVFRGCKRVLTEKEGRERLSRLCKGREKQGERETEGGRMFPKGKSCTV